MSGVPQELVLVPVLFHFFVSDIDSGSAPSAFSNNTKLSHAVNTLEKSDAIQNDPDRLERWVNLRKFNKSKGKVLPMGQGNPKHK